MPARSTALFSALAFACGGGPRLPASDASVDAAASWDAEAPDASPTCAVPDADGDGFDAHACGGYDCDDEDPEIRPGAFDHNGWTIVPVGDDGWAPALATAPDGVLHLVYSSSAGLQHASSDDAWAPETIDPTATRGASIVVASDGAVHVGYVEGTGEGESNLKYAVWADGQWSVEAVAPSASQTSSAIASVALGPDGQPHLGYELRWREGWFRVEVAARSEGSWVAEIVEESSLPGAAPALAWTSDGELHVIATEPEDRDLLHYFRGGDGWTHEIVDNEGGWGRHDVLPSGDGLVVVYGSGNIASWTDGWWTRGPSPSFDHDADLALDLAGQLHMSGAVLDYVFDSGKMPFVTYATPSSPGEWSGETFDECDGGTSIALDLDDRPYIAYENRRAVFLAWRDGELDGIDQNCDGVDGDSPAR